MEHESRPGTGITRSQNIVYVLPHDEASVAQFLAPALERVDETVEELQLLVLVADPETAMTMVAAAGRLTTGRAIAAVPATSARRASRLLRTRPAHVVAGPPDVLVSLIQSAVLKMEHVRVIVLGWADDVLASGGGEALETLMAEIPRTAPRVLVASAITPDVEQLAERYLRRAPRVSGPVTEGLAPVDLQYVLVAPAARPSALRRLLDELDPEQADIFVRSDAAEHDVQQVLRYLGYGQSDSAVRLTRGMEAARASLVILHDLPASRQELSRILGGESRTVVALIQPRQLGALRVLAGGGRVIPLTLPGAAARARARDEAVRAELREILEGGAPARELLALEPLLEEYDGVEIAAAALRLLERERATRPGEARPAPSPAVTPWTRMFVNVGSRDNARAGDLMGAIAGEAGIGREEIGRIDVRDTHSLIEIAPAAAERVASTLTGATIKGRRVVARIDTERPTRGADRDRSGGAGGRERPPRGARREERDRPPRGATRSAQRERSGEDKRPPREGRPSRPPSREDPHRARRDRE